MIQLSNVINKDYAYTQAEAALCIWEYALERYRDARDGHSFEPTEGAFYIWLTDGEGACNGRSNAIELAHLVEHAYQIGNGNDDQLDGYAFDWEVCPTICEEMARLGVPPKLVTLVHATDIGKRLVTELEEIY